MQNDIVERRGIILVGLEQSSEEGTPILVSPKLYSLQYSNPGNPSQTFHFSIDCLGADLQTNCT